MALPFDNHTNFGQAVVSTPPSPATTGTTLGYSGAVNLPAPPYNLVVWPANVDATQSNSEIVRVTADSGTALTIVRAQEGTTAKSIQSGWQMAHALTAKLLTDIENKVRNISGDRIGYVSKGGNDSNDGCSWASAKLTIQAAVNAGKFLIYIGAGDFVETVTITNQIMLLGTSGSTGSFGTVVVAPSASANCIQMTGDRSTVLNIGTRGSGTTWTGAGVYIHGNQNSVINHSHINLDNTATKDFGGVGLLTSHAEGNTVINGYYHECRVGMQWRRETASSTFINIAASLCYCDFWIDGSSDGTGGAMPQGNTVMKFKGVAAKAPTTDVPQVGTPYGYVWLADQSATGSDATANCTFIDIDLDETNQSGFPLCNALVYTEHCSFIGCDSSPETTITFSGKRNTIHHFYNQYHFVLSGTNNYVYDFLNVGSLHAAVFTVTGTDNRIVGFYNNVVGGCTYSVGSGNYFETRSRGFVTDTYSAGISVDASVADVHKVTVTNATQFALVPKNMYEGMRLTYIIDNNSGGAINMRWTPIHKLDATGFTPPANGYQKAITFRYTGSHLIQEGVVSGDILRDQPANIVGMTSLGNKVDTTSATTHTITLTAAASVGDLVYVGSMDASATVTAVSCVDSRGNTYTLAGQKHASNTSTANGAAFFSILATALQVGDTITVTYSAAVASVLLTAGKASGIMPLNALDIVATSVQDSGATFTGSPTLQSGALAQADELVIALYVMSGALGVLPATPASGWTILDQIGTSPYLVVQYVIVSSVASRTAPLVASANAPAGWGALMTTFAAAT